MNKMVYFYDAQVMKVLDGDSVDMVVSLGFKTFRSERFRFYGIDTPETRTRDKEEKARGLSVKEYVKGLIEGKRVRIETHSQGKFGRYLVTIFVDGMNLNQHLVETGRAKAYFGGKR